MTCDYQTRPEQHAELQRCGKPATQQGTTGSRLKYCDDCAKIARKAFKLVPIKLEEVRP